MKDVRRRQPQATQPWAAAVVSTGPAPTPYRQWPIGTPMARRWQPCGWPVWVTMRRAPMPP